MRSRNLRCSSCDKCGELAASVSQRRFCAWLISDQRSASGYSANFCAVSSVSQPGPGWAWAGGTAPPAGGGGGLGGGGAGGGGAGLVRAGHGGFGAGRQRRSGRHVHLLAHLGAQHRQQAQERQSQHEGWLEQRHWQGGGGARRAWVHAVRGPGGGGEGGEGKEGEREEEGWVEERNWQGGVGARRAWMHAVGSPGVGRDRAVQSASAEVLRNCTKPGSA